LDIDAIRAALLYFRSRGTVSDKDKQLEMLENSASLWGDVTKEAPITANKIVPLTKTWSVTIEDQIDKYCKEMAQKLKDSKNQSFWGDEISPAGNQ
jgi:hypothetical protein